MTLIKLLICFYLLLIRGGLERFHAREHHETTNASWSGGRLNNTEEVALRMLVIVAPTLTVFEPLQERKRLKNFERSRETSSGEGESETKKNASRLRQFFVCYWLRMPIKSRLHHKVSESLFDSFFYSSLDADATKTENCFRFSFSSFNDRRLKEIWVT